MNIQSLLKEASPEEVSIPPGFYQKPIQGPTTPLPAEFNMQGPAFSSPSPSHHRSLLSHGRGDLSNSLLNSSQPFGSRIMDNVRQSAPHQTVYDEEDPEVLEAARILFKLSADAFAAEGASGGRVGSSSLANDSSDQRTIVTGSPEPPAHDSSSGFTESSCNNNFSNLGCNSLYKSNSLQSAAYGYSASPPSTSSSSVFSASNQSNLYPRK